MQPQIIQSMHEQVRAIHRALTGEDVLDDPNHDAEDSDDETITRRFAELEVMARAIPSVMERVPPFTFTPALDVIAGDDAVVLELALPGVDRADIKIERTDHTLAISGIRRGGRDLFHAEIPRGPFFRSISLPFPIEPELRTELDRGVFRIYLMLAAPPTDHSNESTNGIEENRK